MTNRLTGPDILTTMQATVRARRLPIAGCVWRFGADAYEVLGAELRARGWPGTGAMLSLSVGGVPVERDAALAADAFYLKEA